MDSNISLAESIAKYRAQKNDPESSLHPDKNEEKDPQWVFYGSTWTFLN